MLAENTYWCQIVSAALTESKTKKSPQLSLQFRCESEANGNDWVALEKPVDRTLHLSLTKGAWPFTEKKLLALGFNGDFNAPAFEQTHAAFYMKFEDYQGKDREVWELSDWGGGNAGPEKASADVIRTFNAKWKQSQSARPAGKPKPPPAPKAKAEPVAAGTGSEDVPF